MLIFHILYFYLIFTFNYVILEKDSHSSKWIGRNYDLLLFSPFIYTDVNYQKTNV